MCEEGYENVNDENDNCYKMHRSGKTWHQALAQCQQDGGSLVHIDDGYENTDVLKFARRRGVKSGSIWLGFNQTGDNSQWSWQPTGMRLGWTAWAGDQPNNWEGKEDCGSMFVSNNAGAWNDDVCDNKLPFVCMTPKKGTTIIIRLHI